MSDVLANSSLAANPMDWSAREGIDDGSGAPFEKRPVFGLQAKLDAQKRADLVMDWRPREMPAPPIKRQYTTKAAAAAAAAAVAAIAVADAEALAAHNEADDEAEGEDGNAEGFEGDVDDPDAAHPEDPSAEDQLADEEGAGDADDEHSEAFKKAASLAKHMKRFNIKLGKKRFWDIPSNMQFAPDGYGSPDDEMQLDTARSMPEGLRVCDLSYELSLHMHATARSYNNGPSWVQHASRLYDPNLSPRRRVERLPSLHVKTALANAPWVGPRVGPVPAVEVDGSLVARADCDAELVLRDGHSKARDHHVRCESQSVSPNALAFTGQSTLAKTAGWWMKPGNHSPRKKYLFDPKRASVSVATWHAIYPAELKVRF